MYYDKNMFNKLYQILYNLSAIFQEENMLYNCYQPLKCKFKTFSMEFPRLLPEARRKCRYIYLRIKHFTSWANARTMAGQTADLEIILFKEEIVKQFEIPSVVLTDLVPLCFSAA